MNCSQCKDDFAAYLEGLLDPEAESRIKSHLSDCPACQAEFDEVHSLVVRLTRGGHSAPGISLENQVMDRIIHEQALVIRRHQMRKRIRLLGISGTLTAAITLFFILGVWMTQTDTRVQAAEVLAQGAKAVPKISTIHIQSRTKGDIFNIDAEGKFVQVELWKQFGENPKWRVEQPGFVVLMDGSTTIQLMKPNFANKIEHPSESDFVPDWLISLANVKDLINQELESALAKGWVMKVAHEQDKGVQKLLVTVEAKSVVSDDDYSKNKDINCSDTRRVYRFDAESKRLEAFNIYLHQKDKDVLIFEANKIEYNQPIDPVIFVLDLPKDVYWYEEPGKLPDNEKYEKMTPKETATAFFEACSKENWDEVKKFWIGPLNESAKEWLGGLQVISIGEPFKSKGYRGWYVPYEIKFKNGEVKKFNLAVWNGNPGKRYIVDGGI